MHIEQVKVVWNLTKASQFVEVICMNGTKVFVVLV